MAADDHQPDDPPDFIVDFTCSIKTEAYAQALQWFGKQLERHRELADVVYEAVDSSWNPLLIGLSWAAEHDLLATFELLMLRIKRSDLSSTNPSPTYPKQEREEGEKDYEYDSGSSAKSSIF